MVLHFDKSLMEALAKIGRMRHNEFLVHSKEVDRLLHDPDSIVNIYGEAKWGVVDVLNQRYSQVLESQIDLYNWLHYNEHDEVAYFLNEAGSNALNYSEFKAPFKIHVWEGRRGFVIGIEQKGKGFNAIQVNELGLKENEGAAFEFFRKCQSSIFFDDPREARIVYLEKIFR